MGAAVSLESFDSPVEAEVVVNHDELQERYEKGFNDGLVAAQAARERSDKSSLEEIAQTLSDIEITFAEARQMNLDSLCSLMDAICNQLVPNIAHHCALPLLRSYIETATSISPQGSVKILVSSEDFEELDGRQIDGVGEGAIAICADPNLQRHQAFVRADGAMTLLDLARVEAEIIEAITAFFEFPERRADHG